MRLQDIHIPETEAFIQGEQIRPFSSMKTLLERIGCKVEEHRVEVHRCSGVQTAQQKFNVEFPAGTSHKAPKGRSSNTTASGRRRRGAKKEVKIGMSLGARTGQVFVPGEDCDYIVTYYQSTEHSPSYFDRGVIEVEKD